ncbi:hypothetical protein N2152v2_009284 [Parachlorella kessleri]
MQTATCNKCGTSRFHTACATNYLEKKFKRVNGKQAKNMAFYLRQPHAELIRGRCPVVVPGSGDDEGGRECPGYVVEAVPFKPNKLPPAPPPALAAAAPKDKKAGKAQKPPPRSASSAQQAQDGGAQPGGKLPRTTGKARPVSHISDLTSGSAQALPQAQQAQQQALPQPGIVRDRLGQRVGPAAAGGEGKKRKPLQFPGGMRPEELALCRHWEARGVCEVEHCVFAHGEASSWPVKGRGREELTEREDEYRGEQARRKREAKKKADEERRLTALKAEMESQLLGAPPTPAAAELVTGAELPHSLPPSASFVSSESSSAAAPWGSEQAPNAADSAACGLGSKKASSVWDELVARAKAGMEAALRPSTAQGESSAARSGATTPSTLAPDVEEEVEEEEGQETSVDGPWQVSEVVSSLSGTGTPQEAPQQVPEGAWHGAPPAAPEVSTLAMELASASQPATPQLLPASVSSLSMLTAPAVGLAQPTPPALQPTVSAPAAAAADEYQAGYQAGIAAIMASMGLPHAGAAGHAGLGPAQQAAVQPPASAMPGWSAGPPTTDVNWSSLLEGGGSAGEVPATGSFPTAAYLLPSGGPPPEWPGQAAMQVPQAAAHGWDAAKSVGGAAAVSGGAADSLASYGQQPAQQEDDAELADMLALLCGA